MTDTISVYYRPAGTSSDGTVYYHKDIVYDHNVGQSNETVTWIQGGQMPDGVHLGGEVVTQSGTPDTVSIEGTIISSCYSQQLASSSDLSTPFLNMVNATNAITGFGLAYDLYTANCNTFADEVLDRAGLTPTIHDGKGGGNWGIGSHLGLASTITVGLWAGLAQELYHLASITGSPLVLDVSDTGSGISLVSASSSNAVYWDFGDGFKHASGWVGSGTGLLCVDPGSTGVITQSDLFGNQPSSGIANGFQALATYDSNSDGVINSSDTNFGNLRVWIDANGNGVSDSGELHTLASLGITSINLSYSDVSYQISGNDILQQSTFTMGGDTRTIADAWFSYDSVNTVYDGSTTINSDTVGLPDQRGYGQMPELAISMSQDSTLLGLVEDLAGKPFAELLDPTYHLETKLQAVRDRNRRVA